MSTETFLFDRACSTVTFICSFTLHSTRPLATTDVWRLARSLAAFVVHPVYWFNDCIIESSDWTSKSSRCGWKDVKGISSQPIVAQISQSYTNVCSLRALHSNILVNRFRPLVEWVGGEGMGGGCNNVLLFCIACRRDVSLSMRMKVCVFVSAAVCSILMYLDVFCSTSFCWYLQCFQRFHFFDHGRRYKDTNFHSHGSQKNDY